MRKSKEIEALKECCDSESLSRYIASLLFNKKWVNESDDFVYVNTDGDNRFTIYNANKELILSVSDFGLVNEYAGEDYLKSEHLFFNLLQKIKEIKKVRNVIQCNL